MADPNTRTDMAATFMAAASERDAATVAVAAATLALAYEQRTANLIAVADSLRDEDYEQVRTQVKQRLGL